MNNSKPVSLIAETIIRTAFANSGMVFLAELLLQLPQFIPV